MHSGYKYTYMCVCVGGYPRAFSRPQPRWSIIVPCIPPCLSFSLFLSVFLSRCFISLFPSHSCECVFVALSLPAKRSLDICLSPLNRHGHEHEESNLRYSWQTDAVVSLPVLRTPPSGRWAARRRTWTLAWRSTPQLPRSSLPCPPGDSRTAPEARTGCRAMARLQERFAGARSNGKTTTKKHYFLRQVLPS